MLRHEGCGIRATLTASRSIFRGCIATYRHCVASVATATADSKSARRLQARRLRIDAMQLGCHITRISSICIVSILPRKSSNTNVTMTLRLQTSHLPSNVNFSCYLSSGCLRHLDVYRSSTHACAMLPASSGACLGSAINDVTRRAATAILPINTKRPLIQAHSTPAGR